MDAGVRSQSSSWASVQPELFHVTPAAAAAAFAGAAAAALASAATLQLPLLLLPLLLLLQLTVPEADREATQQPARHVNANKQQPHHLLLNSKGAVYVLHVQCTCMCSFKVSTDDASEG
jgi:hypothetical protein